VENGPLRFEASLSATKVLDLIGDLALAVAHIWPRGGRTRPGHAMHTALVSRLLKDRSAWELVTLAAEKKQSYAPPESASL